MGDAQGDQVPPKVHDGMLAGTTGSSAAVNAAKPGAGESPGGNSLPDDSAGPESPVPRSSRTSMVESFTVNSVNAQVGSQAKRPNGGFDQQSVASWVNSSAASFPSEDGSFRANEMRNRFMSKYQTSKDAALHQSSEFAGKISSYHSSDERVWRRVFGRFSIVPVVLLMMVTMAAAAGVYHLLVAAEVKTEDIRFIDQARLRSLRLKWELDYVLSQVSPARVLVALLVTLAANPVTAPDRIPGRQVNLTAVWMSLRPDWRAEATRAQFATFTQTIIDVSDGMQGLTWVPILTDPSDREFLEKQAGRQLNLCPALTDAIASNNADVDTVQGKCPKGIRFSERSDKGLGLYQVGDKYAPVEPRGGPWQKGPAWRMCDSVMDAVNGTSPCSTTPYIALTMKNHAFYPVFYLHPGAGNSDAMLFDLSSSGARNGSISKAIIRNGFSTTSRLNLVQETGSQYGFISFIPVYHQLPCKPVAGQNVDFNKLCDTLVGLANAVFRITDLVKHSQESGTSMGDFGNGDATFSQWHDFLLDFGSVEDENDGWVGERIFLKGQDCKKLSTYNETYPNVDELHSSANESASAPNVVETLREILPQICEVVTARGDEFRLHKTGAIDQYKTSEYSFYGEAPGGMFTVFSFFVGDRRWAYIVWSADAAYRVPSQQRAGPIVVLITGIVLGLTAFAGLAYFLERRERARDLTEEIYQAQKTTMVLLANIFPPSYVPRVLRGDTSIAERYEDVTIIFSDIVGFTEFASHCPPKLVVQCLNIMYSIFDDITAKNDVFKVETIGDGYMISSGCPLVTKNNVARAADTAIDMLSAMPTIRELILGLELMENNKKAQEWAANCQIRIGMHTGPVVASVAGKKNPRFHLFGDTVNTASRMESNGTPGRIQMSEATRNYLAEDSGFVCHLRGTCQIKGKGLMNLYYLVGRAPELQEVQSSVSKPLDRTPGKGSREADSSVRPPLSSAEAAPSDVAIDINDAKKV